MLSLFDSVAGIEMDMAVSTLSRLVILQELLPRLPAGARVFVYGMPGNTLASKDARLEDINSEKDYAGDFGFTRELPLDHVV